MSATNTFEASLLNAIFTNSNIANLGDATGMTGSSATGSLHVSLITGTPDLEAVATEQQTSEIGYTGYARQSVTRTTTAAGWTIGASNTVSNATAITFPTSASSTHTATRFGIGSTSTGTGNLFLYGTLTSALNISTGIIPQFAAGALTVTLD